MLIVLHAKHQHSTVIQLWFIALYSNTRLYHSFTQPYSDIFVLTEFIILAICMLWNGFSRFLFCFCSDYKPVFVRRTTAHTNFSSSYPFYQNVLYGRRFSVLGPALDGSGAAREGVGSARFPVSAGIESHWSRNT